MPLDLPQADEAVARRSSIASAIVQLRFEETPAVSQNTAGVAFHGVLGGPDGRYPQINQARRGVLNIGPGGPSAEPHESVGWRMTAPGGWLVGVFPGQVTLQTEDYQGWEDFSGRFDEILHAVGQVVQPAIIERVGLRFTDRLAELEIDSASGWQPYISPEFLGPILVSGLGPAIRSTEQRVVIDVGEGVICNLQHSAADPGDRGSDYYIDCDFYWEGGRPFDSAIVRDQVATFKEQADRVFAAATTATLIERIAS